MAIENPHAASDRELLIDMWAVTNRTEARVVGLEAKAGDHETRIRSLEETRSQQAGVGRMAKFALWAFAPLVAAGSWIGAHWKL